MSALALPLQIERTSDLAYKVAIYDYAGRAGQAVRRLKYSRSTSLTSWMASEIARASQLVPFDVVIPVPIHWARRNERGFNQSELLASALPSSPELLKRIRRTRPQVGLTREQRMTNLSGAFLASPLASGLSVLLIDDVVTSGQTARECAKELLSKGAREVGVLAFCGEPGFREA
ncbi:MAG TPA: ComF family protein [Fimbriimonas sp.]|nr:ComF family protein [Fimbriimonas sp.]